MNGHCVACRQRRFARRFALAYLVPITPVEPKNAPFLPVTEHGFGAHPPGTWWHTRTGKPMECIA